MRTKTTKTETTSLSIIERAAYLEFLQHGRERLEAAKAMLLEAVKTVEDALAAKDAERAAATMEYSPETVRTLLASPADCDAYATASAHLSHAQRRAAELAKAAAREALLATARRLGVADRKAVPA